MDWQGLAIGVILLGMSIIIGILMKVAQQAHDADEFRRATQKEFGQMVERIRDLHSWHDTRDEDGVFKWYIKKALEENILILARSIDRFAKIVEKNGFNKNN